VEAGDALARSPTFRLDRGTLISLQEKLRRLGKKKLAAAVANKNSDRAYLKSLDAEIVRPDRTNSKAQFQSQIAELRRGWPNPTP